MNLLDKIKSQIANFDPNTALSSAMSVIASLTVDSVLSFVYLGLAAVTFRHNIKMSLLKQELESKKIESEIKRIDLENDKLLLENERYKVETNKLIDKSKDSSDETKS